MRRIITRAADALRAEKEWLMRPGERIAIGDAEAPRLVALWRWIVAALLACILAVLVVLAFQADSREDALAAVHKELQQIRTLVGR